MTGPARSRAPRETRSTMWLPGEAVVAGFVVVTDVLANVGCCCCLLLFGLRAKDPPKNFSTFQDILHIRLVLETRVIFFFTYL